MVEYNSVSTTLNSVFGSLSDPTRRDMLLRATKKELSIGELAKPYSMSFAAVAKHVTILEEAGLVTKRQVGKQQLVKTNPQKMRVARAYLEKYEQLWRSRFSQLDELLVNNK